ncbi:MAG: hypothetical protein EOL87_16845 [Spartobacteria bacterium]|nr:hypothetical protein [Spartobacteria bacterium]
MNTELGIISSCMLARISSWRIKDIAHFGILFWICCATGLICRAETKVATTDRSEEKSAILKSIRDDPDLSTVGGVAIKQIYGGLYLATVGWTEMKTPDDPREIIRCQKVAQSKARAELAQYLGSAVSVERSLTAEEPKDVDTLKVYISQHARQILQGLKGVGSWDSEGKTIHFEAMATRLYGYPK